MMTDQDEPEVLRRRLRAMSAVNEQLRAQLAATQDELAKPRQAVAADPFGRDAAVPVGLAPRRASIAAGWLDRVPAATVGSRAAVLEAPDGSLFVVDGDVRRPLRSGLLAIALEEVCGERRRVTDEELAGWSEGAPVELLEAASGLPFVVLEGRKVAVRGLPLPFPVDQERADRVPAGPDLDVAAAVMPRRAHEAHGWIAELLAGPGAAPVLVTGPDGAGHVVEGSVRRTVRSGLLVPALGALLGEARPMGEAELAALTEGPPVEILEARAGEPFVVLGGRRSRLVGFPVPHPVVQDQADALPDGPPLDVGGTYRAIQRDLRDQVNAATTARDRAERKVDRVQAKLDAANRAAAKRQANPDPKGELRRLIDKRGGVVPLATHAAKRGVRKLVTRS